MSLYLSDGFGTGRGARPLSNTRGRRFGVSSAKEVCLVARDILCLLVVWRTPVLGDDTVSKSVRRASSCAICCRVVREVFLFAKHHQLGCCLLQRMKRSGSSWCNCCVTVATSVVRFLRKLASSAVMVPAAVDSFTRWRRSHRSPKPLVVCK